MQIFQKIPSKFKRFLPFLLIFLAVVYLSEREKQFPLSAPQMKLLSPEMRTQKQKDFTLPTLHGDLVRLADFRGNVVLLNVFATWCHPCRDEIPSLEALFQAYQSRGFVVLGVSTDTNGEKVLPPFIKEYALTFPIVVDTDKQVSQQYGVRGIPATFLLDQHGRIAGMLSGSVNWDSEEAHALIEQLLQE
ncbi:thiol-disulfide oxidoreductase resA [Candidatus Vecturithrix granuli]|uniref:Thiol-disulfide oxidoreductase resA n=1 Tax=Vecturithrix granuli TaxID=1499967 RepID=A0A081BZ77_VECG1|nr:thiol-disulfide oxidoreductase resA [Candidatus Vecturithrix granuli]